MSMEDKRCLYCYQMLNQEEHDMHASCSRKFFGSSQQPLLSYSEAEMFELGIEVIRSQSAVTGVQPKLTLHLEKPKHRETPRRFTIVGLWGNYILKPPVDQYPNLPELEDLTMHLAENCGIQTVPHALIRLGSGSGSLAYITRRIDRIKAQKIHMEDMCQLTERLTEDKYKGSVEQIGKVIYRRSVRPGFDLVTLFELVLFSFLVGNGDMHLKNYALLHEPGVHLAPAFDLLNTRLLIPEHIDNEDTALSVNGRRRKLKINDFFILGESLRMTVKQTENVMKRYQRLIPGMFAGIEASFLPEDLKQEYKRIVYDRAKRLFLV